MYVLSTCAYYRLLFQIWKAVRYFWKIVPGHVQITQPMFKYWFHHCVTLDLVLYLPVTCFLSFSFISKILSPFWIILRIKWHSVHSVYLFFFYYPVGLWGGGQDWGFPFWCPVFNARSRVIFTLVRFCRIPELQSSAGLCPFNFCFILFPLLSASDVFQAVICFATCGCSCFWHLC